jgi:hypothetical protein
MKKYLFLALTAFMMLSFNTTDAQKIKLLAGKVDFLKGQTAINIEFFYDDMMVGKKKEKEWAEKKIQDKNKMKAGDGDKWYASWVADRDAKFEVKFTDLFNKGMTKKSLIAKEGQTDAKYTMVVSTIFTEPGVHTGFDIGDKDAYISVEVSFYETANKSAVLAKVGLFKAIGTVTVFSGGSEYATADRLGEAYAKCGKSLAAFLMKNLK